MKKLKRTIITLLFIAIIMSSHTGCGFVKAFKEFGQVNSTTDVTTYGDFPTTKYGYEIKPYTDNILPPKIEDFFAVEEYYFAYCDAPYMHEVYLEVSIDDEEKYTEYVAELLADKETECFFYNADYQEYVLTDVLRSTESNWVEKSEIQKILFNDNENKIIFISLLVLHQDSPFYQEDFVYFEKFNIPCVGDYYGGTRVWKYKVNELPYLY